MYQYYKAYKACEIDTSKLVEDYQNGFKQFKVQYLKSKLTAGSTSLFYFNIC